jgi:hypothetical protein
VKSSGTTGFGAKVTPAVASVPTRSRDVWLRLTDVGGEAFDGGGGGGGGVLEGVHPERFVTTDVDPSLTVALQVLDR